MKNLNSKCGRTLSRFSIRKCSVGTASFLIGTVAFFGIHHEAFAAENSKTPVPVTQLLENSNKESTEEKTDLQTNENETLQGGVSNNTLNREVEKENVNGIQEKPMHKRKKKHYLILNSHVLRNKTTQLRQLHRKRMITNFL